VSTFRDSPGLRQLIETAQRIHRDFAPTPVTVILPVLDLGRQRRLMPGARITLPAAEADALIARGFARR
jgi:hypothetical protein